MKVLHVVFSCNRLKYLTKTIDSWNYLDYGDHQVDRLIIDDYPRTRNDAIFQLLGKAHGAQLHLNQENYGLSLNWSRFFDWLKTQDYDYILHQEDDVVLLEPIKLNDLIEILETDPKMASVVLQRQPWYFHETPSKIEPEDIPIKQYYYNKTETIFSIIFSLYRKNIIDYGFREYWKFNVNEGMIMVYLHWAHQMYSAVLKNSEGKNLIEHIGEECTGKRLLEGEPNWQNFAFMDPNRVYTSREGKLVE